MTWWRPHRRVGRELVGLVPCLPHVVTQKQQAFTGLHTADALTLNSRLQDCEQHTSVAYKSPTVRCQGIVGNGLRHPPG